MKKVLNIVLVLFILLFIHLLSRYLVNEIYISNYNNAKYNSKIVNYLFIINSPEPYVAHYNYGNNLYMQKDYKQAKKEFEKALNTAPLSKRCYVRYNLALSMLELVDYSNESIANTELEQIKKVLEGDNCANNQGTGDNSDSQNLHDDIEEYQNKDNDGESSKDEPDVDEEELKEKLDEQKEQAEEERNDMYDPNYSSYTGDKW